MSSSDDDLPLRAHSKVNGVKQMNGGKARASTCPFTRVNCWLEQLLSMLTVFSKVPSHLSATKIPHSVDAAMDRRLPSNGEVQPGVSLMNGPMMEGDIRMKDADKTEVNGTGSSKRKARSSIAKPSYAEPESSDDDDQPIVHHHPLLFNPREG